ncbi:Fanconi anemia group M protein, partial [Biomphalaria pfeifferi]
GKTQGNIFIEEEAEVSEEHSSDESEYFDDLYDASFIDNSEVIHSIETDMHAVYLKSVRSPLLHGQFKLLYDKEKPNMDIYSQTLSEDHGNSKYEEDSFCVGNEDKDSCVTEGESSHYKFTKLSKKSERKKKRAGKRILFLCDSSSKEEDKEHVNLTEEFNVKDRQNVKKLLSSSEDEASTHLNINEHSKTIKANMMEKIKDTKSTDIQQESSIQIMKAQSSLASELSFKMDLMSDNHSFKIASL